MDQLSPQHLSNGPIEADAISASINWSWERLCGMAPKALEAFQVDAASQRFEALRETVRALGAQADRVGATAIKSYNDIVV